MNIRPLITEKTLLLADTENKYTFYVDPSSNKIEIAKYIASEYDVKVLSVVTMNYLGKKVNFGRKRIQGQRQSFKKAIVTLNPGDVIKDFNLN